MPFTVTPIAPYELLPALRFLFPDRAEISDLHFDPSGVLVVRDAGGGILGAILAQSMPGALGIIWPPRAPSDELRHRLVRAAHDWFLKRGVKACQAFSMAGEEPLMASLEPHGFRHITQLVTLQCAIGGELPENPLEFHAERPPFSAACRAVLLSIHEGTLDCPELNLGRTPGELLAEFAEMGSGSTWHVAYQEEVPVGIAILAPSVTENEVELAYLGVAPTSRGRGLSGNLLAFARREAKRRGASSLIVSVDNRNWPAIRLYRKNGFTETQRRDVWLAHFL